MSASGLVGYHSLKWKGGEFEVCFRPAGKFFCQRFQAQATWKLEGNVVNLDWGKFGKYEFVFNAEDKTLTGNALPKKEEDESNWRTASFVRELSPVEWAILGDGAGTEWELEHAGGSFPVEFKADGYNHFKCSQFPAHSHWSFAGDKFKINWGEFGNYEFTVDASTKTMQGFMVGADPAVEWRKAKHLRNLLDQAVVEDCEHHH